MAKSYGITCDSCKNKITSPGGHYKVKIVNQLIVNQPYNYDLCYDCFITLQNLLEKGLQK